MYNKKTSYDFLYLFRDVMRCGSFQKAAKEAGCTAASVGKKMAQMEAELDIILFEQGSNGMNPTAAGLFLYDKLDSVLWNLDSMLQQAKNIPAEDSMKLNIAISDMLCGSSYRQLIQNFTKSHPDVEFTLSAPTPSDMRRKLIDGRMDVALTYSVGLMDEPRMERMPLYRTKPYVYYNKHMEIGDPNEMGLEAFRACPFVCLNTDVAAMNVLRDLPFEPKKVYFVDSLKSLYLYVNAGLACCVLGASQQLSEAVDIGTFELTDVNNTMGIDLIWEKSNTNPAIRLLKDCAEKTFRLPSEEPDCE